MLVIFLISVALLNIKKYINKSCFCNRRKLRFACCQHRSQGHTAHWALRTGRPGVPIYLFWKSWYSKQVVYSLSTTYLWCLANRKLFPRETNGSNQLGGIEERRTDQILQASRTSRSARAVATGNHH